jgi:hypothetical protein
VRLPLLRDDGTSVDVPLGAVAAQSRVTFRTAAAVELNVEGVMRERLRRGMTWPTTNQCCFKPLICCSREAALGSY